MFFSQNKDAYLDLDLMVSNYKITLLINRVGAFFFIVMNQVFGNMSAVELFIKERAIFM